MSSAISVAELGHYALVLALALMLIQSSVPLLGLRWGDQRLVAVARTAPVAGFGFMLLAFAALVAAYV
jgi:cytochrome c-type biogenesis protein CcmF